MVTTSLEVGEEMLPASNLIAGFDEILPRRQAVAVNLAGSVSANHLRPEPRYETALRTSWRHGGINE